MNLKKVRGGAVLSTCAWTGGTAVWVRGSVIFGQFSQKLKRWELRSPDLLTLRAPCLLVQTAACVGVSSSNSQSTVNVDNLRTSPSAKGFEVDKKIDVEEAV